MVEEMELPSADHWTGNTPAEWIAFLEFNDYAPQEMLDWLTARLPKADD